MPINVVRSFKVFLLLFFFLSSCDYLRSKNFQIALSQQKCADARQILLGEIKRNIDKEVPEYNLVQTFICAGDFVSALKQINSLLKNKPQYAFELNFIKGYLLGEIGDVDEALRSYQNALDLHSDVRVKQNMELLLQASKNGSGGKKKKGKGKKEQNSQTDQNSEGDQEDQQRQSQQSDSKPNDKEPKGEKSKRMSQKQIEKIMKEIDGDEKKIRSQGLKIKSKKGGKQNGKNW